MKKLYCATLGYLIGMSCLGQGPAAGVRILENDYPMGFEDASLSATNKQRIASDLTTVFSLAVSFDKLKGEEAESGVFRLGDSLMFLSGEETNILIDERDSPKSIRMGKALSDKYLQAFALADTHSNAVRKAHEFVALLNSTNLFAQPPAQVIRQICHITPQAQALLENLPNDQQEFAKAQELIADFGQWEYAGFTVLNFSLRQVISLGDTDETRPVIFLFTIQKANPSNVFGFPMTFYEGKWGFGGRVPDLEIP